VQAQTELPLHRTELSYTVDREFTSPVTGQSLTATVLARGVGYGVRDYDGCPHPPINALAYAVVIDPVTGYVAYPEEFERPTTFSAEQLESVLGKPRFSRSAPDGLPWHEAYAWEKYENAAKLAEASKAKASAVANWWLQAAWSVRLDLMPAYADFASELAGSARGLPQGKRDPADVLTPYTLQLANGWVRFVESGGKTDSPAESKVNTATSHAAPPSIREDPGAALEPPPISGGFIADGQSVDVQSAALAIAWAYRSRGELPAAKHWLNKAALADASLKSTPLFTYLDNSINLERDYLSKAQRWLRQAYDSGELRESQRGAAAFNLGEIARRLGDREGALHWYGEAEGKSLGSVSPKLLQRQKAVVSSNSPYV
jgi:hypothetical protein